MGIAGNVYRCQEGDGKSSGERQTNQNASSFIITRRENRREGRGSEVYEKTAAEKPLLGGRVLLVKRKANHQETHILHIILDTSLDSVLLELNV